MIYKLYFVCIYLKINNWYKIPDWVKRKEREDDSGETRVKTRGNRRDYSIFIKKVFNFYLTLLKKIHSIYLQSN